MGATPTFRDLQVLSPISWVKEEQARQVAKWGKQNHGPYKYFTILAEEFGEVGKVLEDVTYGKYESHEEFRRHLEYEILQTAAVAVSWVEAIRREKGAEQPPKCPCKSCRKHDRISTLMALVDDYNNDSSTEDWEIDLAQAARRAVKALQDRQGSREARAV